VASYAVPTRAERTALVFLSAVLLTGGLVRLSRAVDAGKRPPAAAAVALAEQQRAVDSAAEARRARAARPASAAQQAGRAGSAPGPLINVNRASAAELEALPRIGPALAARIVADREANGPFSTVDALESRVKGIGPALARTIAPHVTFLPR
jgi:competence protein ComEA